MVFISDNKINLPVGQLESKAIPAVKRDLFKIFQIKTIDMLSQYPKSRGGSAYHDCLDVFD